jgi:hypothetical protein
MHAGVGERLGIRPPVFGPMPAARLGLEPCEDRCANAEWVQRWPARAFGGHGSNGRTPTICDASSAFALARIAALAASSPSDSRLMRVGRLLVACCGPSWPWRAWSRASRRW